MKKIPVYGLDGQIVGHETLNEELLAAPLNKDILYYYATAFRANQRQGNASAKTRAEVSGSGRKPWRQKGTGRARVGETRNPLWRHGGVTFGPKPRDYRVSLPAKVKKGALREALKDKLSGDRVILLQVENVETPQTKIFAGFLKKAGLQAEKTLFILSRNVPFRINAVKSIRNLGLAGYNYEEQINAYEIMKSDRLIVFKDSFGLIKKSLGEDHAA